MKMNILALNFHLLRTETVLIADEHQFIWGLFHNCVRKGDYARFLPQFPVSGWLMDHEGTLSHYDKNFGIELLASATFSVTFGKTVWRSMYGEFSSSPYTLVGPKSHKFQSIFGGHMRCL